MANSSASDVEPSTQCASSTTMSNGAVSAYAANKLNVAAPMAKRSSARAGPSASALSRAVICGGGIGEGNRAQAAIIRTVPRTGPEFQTVRPGPSTLIEAASCSA